jgi:hypothetical protein
VCVCVVSVEIMKFSHYIFVIILIIRYIDSFSSAQFIVLLFVCFLNIHANANSLLLEAFLFKLNIICFILRNNNNNNNHQLLFII